VMEEVVMAPTKFWTGGVPEVEFNRPRTCEGCGRLYRKGPCDYYCSFDCCYHDYPDDEGPPECPCY